MPKGQTNFIRPNNPVTGAPLKTVEEAVQITGLSAWHLRERTRPHGRGKFIPSYKIGARLWFDETDLKEAVFQSNKRTAPEPPKVDVSYI